MRTFFVLLFSLIAFNVFAQAIPQKVNINEVSFYWSWSQGTGSAADGFNVKCGPSSNSYTIFTTVTPSTVQSVPLKNVIAQNGIYYCTVVAFNGYGESPPSGELFFDAGAVPLPVSGVVLKK